jgi:hypothetical protein
MNPVPEAVALRRLYWTSFWLRFAVGLLVLYLSWTNKLQMMEDSFGYSYWGAEIARAWLSGQQSPWLAQAMAEGRKAWFMYATVGVFYCVTGGVEVLPFAIGCYSLLTSFAPVLAYRAGRQFGASTQEALSGARLIAYSPAFALWSSALYKEGLILIALFLVVLHSLRLQQNIRPGSILLLALCLLALFGLRFYIAAILCVCLVTGLLFGLQNRDAGEDAPVIFRQVLVLVLLFCVFSLFGLRERVDKLVPENLEDNIKRFSTIRRGFASEGSGYLREMRFSNVDSAVRFFPVGLTYFLLVPFPWQLGSLRQNVTIPETLFWVVVVYPRVLRGVWRGVKVNPPGALFLLLSSVSVCCLYALVMGNIGTTYRVRTQVWAIWALFAGVGWSKKSTPPAGEVLDGQIPETRFP